MRNQSPTDKHVYLSEDQVSVAEAAGAVTRAACLPGAPLQQVRAAATVLANLLESKDEQLLKESCVRLCQLFGDGIQNDRIQSILEAAVVPKLVHLLEPVEKKNGVFEFRVTVTVQSAALQVIGNIACGDDRQTQVIIDCNVLPCLRALLTCDERGIRKECCWIISNISESAHQVQDVIDAGILPFLLRLLESQDGACREDATWVLYNVTANRDEKQIDYLSEQGCVRALCSLLSCTKELDVNWKGCGTIAEVALKGLRNVLAVGEERARREGFRLNKYGAVVVNSYGVERIEALTHHRNIDIRIRARALLTAFFGTESGENELSQRIGGSVSSPSAGSSSTADSDPEEEDDEDSLFDFTVNSAEKCQCVACLDLSRLPDKRVKPSEKENGGTEKDRNGEMIPELDVCECCDGSDVVGKTRTVLSIKIGRAVRLGHRHCLAVLLSRMTWSQRGSAIEAPSGINSNLLPPEAAMTCNLPAFVLAAQGGKADCLELLVRRCQPDLDMTYGKKRLTALAWAAHKGNIRCCKILRENGASPAAKCADGVTALHLAASGGSLSVCKLLLEHGAPVNAKSTKRQTPLCLAAQRGHVNIVRVLLNAGASTKHEDDQNFTPLHLAALHGHDAVLTALIDAGANVNAKNVTGTTPICYAVQRRHAKCVRILINRGAKLCIPGSSPLLFIAADEGDVECVQALLDANTPLSCRANIKVLINKDYEMMDSLSPLHLAASKGHNGVVELLLKRGVDVDERSSKGWSALDFAVLNGHVMSANTLIFYGAIVDDGPKVIGRGSWTLVQHAAHSGNKDIVRLLIQRIQEQTVQGLVSGNDAFTQSPPVNREPPVTNGVVEKKKKTKESKEEEKESSHRNRDVKRWEMEFAEARERLEEAASQRSAVKLKEGNAYANKILLHIAASAGDDEAFQASDAAAQLAVQSMRTVLSGEIERNRKILVEVQLEDKRTKEKRDAAAANARKGNARKSLAEVTDDVKKLGWDPRILQRAMKKAQLVLDVDDETLKNAQELSTRLVRSQEIDQRLSDALAESRIEAVELSIEELEAEVEWHQKESSLKALERVLGCDVQSRIAGAKERARILRAEIEAARAEEERLRKAEEDAIQRLELAAKTGSLSEIEERLSEIGDFTSSNPASRSVINTIRKNFQKSVKNERRKLRQACSTESRETISKALDEARSINLRAVEADVTMAQDALSRLEDRDRLVEQFQTAKEERIVSSLQQTKARFEKLGMLQEAEEARLLVDSLLKEERAKSQLEAAMSAGEVSLESLRNRNPVWPDGRRLMDMIKRGRNFDSVSSLVTKAEVLGQSLGAAGREFLLWTVGAGDAKEIAAALYSYEKSFLTVERQQTPASDLFNATTNIAVLEEARDKLAEIQREEQARALAETEAHAAAMRAAAEVSKREIKEEHVPSRSHGSESDEIDLSTGQPSIEDLDEDGLERDATESAVCVHYYLWRGGNTVMCSRCGNERCSTNEDWLTRVRRRALKGADGELEDDLVPLSAVSVHQSQRNGLVVMDSSTVLDGRNSHAPPLVPLLTDNSESLPLAHNNSASAIDPLRIVPTMHDDSAGDISAEFARQHFGFDIDAIVNDS